MNKTLSRQMRLKRTSLRHIFALATAMVWYSSAALAEEFSIFDPKIVLSDKVYQLDAKLEFTFSKDVLEAIDSGVPVELKLEIEIQRPRSYIWDKEVYSLEQRYQLQYHALSEQYIARNLNSGAQYSFFSLNAALRKIGQVEHLPIIDAQLLKHKDEEHYYARIRTTLGFDNLPVPLKLSALVSRSWWLSSDWVEIKL